MIAINDWVKLTDDEDNLAFKVIGVKDTEVFLCDGSVEPMQRLEKIDLNKCEITSHFINRWFIKELQDA